MFFHRKQQCNDARIHFWDIAIYMAVTTGASTTARKRTQMGAAGLDWHPNGVKSNPKFKGVWGCWSPYTDEIMWKGQNWAVKEDFVGMKLFILQAAGAYAV